MQRSQKSSDGMLAVFRDAACSGMLHVFRHRMLQQQQVASMLVGWLHPTIHACSFPLHPFTGTACCNSWVQQPAEQQSREDKETEKEKKKGSKKMRKSEKVKKRQKTEKKKRFSS
jgi:hypothetical protein